MRRDREKPVEFAPRPAPTSSTCQRNSTTTSAQVNRLLWAISPWRRAWIEAQIASAREVLTATLDGATPLDAGICEADRLLSAAVLEVVKYGQPVGAA